MKRRAHWVTYTVICLRDAVSLTKIAILPSEEDGRQMMQLTRSAVKNNQINKQK